MGITKTSASDITPKADNSWVIIKLAKINSGVNAKSQAEGEFSAEIFGMLKPGWRVKKCTIVMQA